MTLKPCPFCGKELDPDTHEYLHKNGLSWIERDGTRTYRCTVSKDSLGLVSTDRFQVGDCYDIHCSTMYGGCGGTVSGDSKEEVISKWNSRTE